VSGTMMDEERQREEKKSTATAIISNISIHFSLSPFQTLNYTLLISFYLAER